MASRNRDRYRTHSSGHQKRLKKEKVEAFMQQQRGSFDKFINTREQPSILKESPDILTSKDDEKFQESAYVYSIDKNEKSDMDYNIQEVPTNVNTNAISLESVQNYKLPEDESQNTLINKSAYDLEDPGCWPLEITHNIRMEILTLGPKRDTNHEFPANNESVPRKFTSYHFYRVMSNGERVDREWMVY